MRKEFRKQDYILIFLAIGLVICFIIGENLKTKTKDRWYNKKIKAAILMEKSMKALKEERIKRGLEIDKTYDINGTGLIGLEMSPITTTLGSLEAKRTSTNPNFAAVIVDMLKELKIEKDDSVVVNFSGSFPALNIAVLSAVQVLEINPIVISSIGSSAWGGNNPDFTYGDMEKILYDKGILKKRSIAFSLGGADDIGKNMDGQIASQIINRLNQERLIYQPDFKKNIEERYKLYLKGNKEIKVFINVGGNLVSMGMRGDGAAIEPGINLKNPSLNNKELGLIGIFLNKNIPVIHLLNIRKLAAAYGLPIDPSPLPKPGEGEIYFQQQYPLKYIGIVLGIGIFTLLFYGRRIRREYDREN